MSTHDGGGLYRAISVLAFAHVTLMLVGSAVADADASYQDYVEQYRHGDREAVLRQVASWSPEGLKRELDQATGDGFPFATAVMLHTDCALRAQSQEDAPGFARQIEAARNLVERLPKDAAFAGRWYLAAGYLVMGGKLDPRGARSLLERGLKSSPADAQLRLAMGAAAEMEARMTESAGQPPSLAKHTVFRAGSSTRLPGEEVRDRRALLRAAEEEYRRALATEPDLAEAHLRRGSVLARLGRAASARGELKWVVSHSDDGHVLYLCHLFRGRIEQDAGHLDAAVAAYRMAVAQNRGSQAGNLALGQVLDRLGQRASAVEALRQAVTLRGQDDSWWLYFSGHLHLCEALFDSLRKEATS
jgi:tetratricopeptide (TPR) repeat protein